MSAPASSPKDVILEIGTEEIPSRFIVSMLGTLKALAAESLAQLRIPFNDVRTYATPRRLVLSVHYLADRQEDLVATYKGPHWASAFDSSGNATRA